MKFQILALSGFLMINAMQAQARPNHGFCWGQTSHEVVCTQIASAEGVVILPCRAWAASIGASRWGSMRDSDLARLTAKQVETCTTLEGMHKYGCFIEEACSTTSSIRPAGGVYVFAPHETAAINKCVDTASAEYLNALKGLAADCRVAPRVAVTMP